MTALPQPRPSRRLVGPSHRDLERVSLGRRAHHRVAAAAAATKALATVEATSAKRRSQPRAVHSGTPSRPAIRRCAQPAALASNAAPITSAASTRPPTNTSGQHECVFPHGLAVHSTRWTSTTPSRVCFGHQPANVNRSCPHTGQRSGRGVTTRPRLATNSNTAPTANTINTAATISPRPSDACWRREGHLNHRPRHSPRPPARQQTRQSPSVMTPTTTKHPPPAPKTPPHNSTEQRREPHRPLPSQGLGMRCPDGVYIEREAAA